MIQALCDHLLEKPYLYLDEMVIFMWDEFQAQVTSCCISRALKQEGLVQKDLSKKQENEMQIYGMPTFILHLIFTHIILFTWTRHIGHMIIEPLSCSRSLVVRRRVDIA